jgi:hypothetical protein
VVLEGEEVEVVVVVLVVMVPRLEVVLFLVKVGKTRLLELVGAGFCKKAVGRRDKTKRNLKEGRKRV